MMAAAPRYLDWTRNPDISSLTPFQQFVRNVDWTKSPLGPMDAWPAQLRQMVCVVMADPHPAVVYWGEEMTIVYNEPYTHLIGQKHPSLQGSDPKIGFAEIWDRFDPIIRHGMETGETTIEGQQPLLLDRYGFLEETYFSWKFIPMVGPDGTVTGSYATVVEATREVIAERRMASIHNLGEKTAMANNMKAVWTGILDGLESNDNDLPIVLAYSMRNSLLSPPLSSTLEPDSLLCHIEGSVGIPASRGHLVPDHFALEDDGVALAPLFQSAMKSKQPLLVQEDKLPSSFVGKDGWRGFGHPSTTAIICPIRSRPSDMPMGFVMIGLSPHRRYDQEYQDYIRSVVAQIATPHIFAMQLADEMRQNTEAAQRRATQQNEYSQELRLRALAIEQDEMKFSHFADRAPVGFAVIDSVDGKILYGNDFWFHTTGIERNEISQLAWMNCVVEEDKHILSESWIKLIQQKTVVRYVARFKTPWKDEEGQRESPYSTGLCTGYPDLDEQGNVKTVTSVIMSMNERIWAEEQLFQRTKELEQSEANYRRFADAAPIGVASLTPDGQVDYGNDSWRLITSQKINDEPMAWMSVIHPDDQVSVQEYFEALIKSEEVRTIETRLNRPEKPDDPLYIMASAYADFVDGKVTKIVCWLTDVTALKTAELALQKRMDEAIAMKKRQENFIDMTSHEIRNPLSAVLHCAEEIVTTLNNSLTIMTQSSNSSCNKTNSGVTKKILESFKSTIDAAQTISYCVQHQQRIVDDVLTLSKLESDLLLITPVSVSSSTVIQEALKMFEAERKEAGIDLLFYEHRSLIELDAQWLLFDSNRMLQVFINLITNAIKFTRGSKKRSIKVTINTSISRPSDDVGEIEYLPPPTGKQLSFDKQWAAQDTVYLSLTVEDTGCGISREERKALFNRFSQGSPKTQVKYGGSGLGLWISRQIVELMGGEMGLKSEKGLGSTFTFFIKSKRMAAPVENTTPSVDNLQRIRLENMVGHPDTSMVAEHEQEPRANPSPRTNVSKIEMKVLVVEDNLINQKVLSKQLRRFGHTVEVANHGEQALEILKKTSAWKQNTESSTGKRFDIILMDIEMPVMNGLTCVKQIREHEESGTLTGHTPVIAVTANVRSEHVEIAMAAGMDDVTTKPYKMEDILSQMHRAYLSKTRTD